MIGAAPLPHSWSMPATLKEALARHRMLAHYGLALLAIAVPVMVLQAIDPRTLHDVSIWIKPAKFLVSIGIFALTMAWFLGYVRPERRHAPLLRAMVWTLIASSAFELIYITWQAALGQDSHFNVSSPFHIVMYAMMGVSAVLLVGTTLPLAWEIARRPAAGLRADFRIAVISGLLLTFALGGGLGGYMSTMPGHSVGAAGGHVPIFGWNRMGGDLRIAHFLGIHAQQALPVLALLMGGWPVGMRWVGLVTGTLAYVMLTIALFGQALSGRALLPL